LAGRDEIQRRPAGGALGTLPRSRRWDGRVEKIRQGVRYRPELDDKWKALPTATCLTYKHSWQRVPQASPRSSSVIVFVRYWMLSFFSPSSPARSFPWRPDPPLLSGRPLLAHAAPKPTTPGPQPLTPSSPPAGAPAARWSSDKSCSTLPLPSISWIMDLTFLRDQLGKATRRPWLAAPT